MSDRPTLDQVREFTRGLRDAVLDKRLENRGTRVVYYFDADVVIGTIRIDSELHEDLEETTGRRERWFQNLVRSLWGAGLLSKVRVLPSHAIEINQWTACASARRSTRDVRPKLLEAACTQEQFEDLVNTENQLEKTASKGSDSSDYLEAASRYSELLGKLTPMAFPTLYAVAWNAEARWEDLFKNRIEHFRQSLSAVDLYDPDDSLLMKLCVQQASQRRHNRGSVVNDAVAVRTLLRLHEMAAGSDTRIRFFTTTDSLQSAFFTPEVLDKLGETSTHAEWNKGGRVSEHFPLRSASYFLLRCAVPELRFTHDQSQSTTRQRALLRLVSKRLDTLTELLKARDQQDQVWEFLDTCEIGRKRISNLITETQSVGIHQSATEESAGRLIKNLSESQKRRPLTKIYESSSGRSKTIARVAQHQLDVFDDSMVMAREFTETIALLMKQPDESINRALAKLIPMTRPGKEELNRLIEELLPERDFVSTFFIGEADQEISAKVVEYAERMLPGFVSMREEISEDGIRVRFELVRDLYRTSGDPEQVVMWTGLLHYLGYEQAALQFVRQAYESWRLAGKEHLWTPELEILERVLTIDSWARRPSLTLAKIDEERSWTVDLVRKHRRETTSQAAAMYLWAIASTKTVVHEVSLRESNKIKSELFRDVLEILETFSLNGIGYTSYNAAYLAVSADMQLRLKHRDALAKRPIEGALNAKIREYRQLIREARGNQKDSARVEALDARCDLQRWVPALEATSEIVRKHYIATELDQVADVKNHIEVIQRHAIESRWDKLCNELAHVVAEMDNALNALNALLR